MPKLAVSIGAAVFAAMVILLSSVFIVHETEQVIVLQFGDPVRVVQEPGLNFKTPLIQELVRYEKRVLNIDPPVERVLLRDQRPINVDTFARYTITDPLEFYKNLRSEGQALPVLYNMINSVVRNEVGNVLLQDILSDKRINIMTRISDQITTNARRFGIEVVDVRIGRADLPDRIMQAVYNRMRSEREAQAKKERAEGQKQAQQIRATAEKERTIALAEAEKQAQQIRGVGDEEAIRIYADAYGKDARFYNFYRSLEAYRNTLSKKDTRFVLSPDNKFLQYLAE